MASGYQTLVNALQSVATAISNISSVAGPKGDKGDQGDTGPAGTITDGSVTVVKVVDALKPGVPGGTATYNALATEVQARTDGDASVLSTARSYADQGDAAQAASLSALAGSVVSAGDLPAAIAANSAVTTAASTAAAAAVAGIKVQVFDTTPSSIAFVISDANNAMSWLAIGPDGGVPAWSASKIAAAVKDAVAAYATGQIGFTDLGQTLPDGLAWAITDSTGRIAAWNAVTATGGMPAATQALVQQVSGFSSVPGALQSYVVTDAQGRRSDLELDAAGRISDRVLARWASRLNVVSSTDVAAISVAGDSFSTFSAYQSAIAAETGLAVDASMAWGGRQSTEIAIHQGGLCPLVTLAGNQIPASGAVAVTLVSPTNGFATTYSGAASVPWYYHGSIAGVPGQLVQDPQTPLVQPSRWQFIRDAAGSVVSLSSTVPVEFVPDESTARRGDIQVLWPGRNSVYNKQAYANSQATQNAIPETDSRRQLLRDVMYMTEYVKSQPRRRFMVVGICNAPIYQEYIGGAQQSNYDVIVDYNARMSDLLGPRFIDVRRYLIDHGLSDLGLSATSQDTTDIGRDVVPTQLFRVDLLHLSDAAFGVAGAQVGRRIKQLGWA